MNLLPPPRSLKLQPGKFILSKRNAPGAIKAIRSKSAPNHPEGYTLTISKTGIEISFRETGGLRAVAATLRQILREHGRHLPCLKIRDWPDFPRRGVMLDISRGRVPKLATLLDLTERLADFKINELQLYTEHTFAYRKYKPVWQSWGALTAAEIRTLDTRCRELGIDLVPNQNSFGHLGEFLAHPPLKKLAEVPEAYESDTSDFIRHPTTLAPDHPGTLPFLRGLYDELLPNFSSRFFNVGCDETWDLGRGQSKHLCTRLGKGRVYLDFLKKIHREVSKQDKRMMFWGDIILKYPKLIPKLAKFRVPPSGGSGKPPEGGTPSLIALNWGYEANHPFDEEAALFAKSKIPFYVCPGTSTWMTLIGRHDNAFDNLRAAAKAGRKHGALGYLITDWGDGGHPQPLAVSWLPYLYGASVSWCAKSFDAIKEVNAKVRSSAFRRQPRPNRLKAELQTKTLTVVLSRDVFCDPSRRVAKAALALGFVHREFGYKEMNQTPFGTVIAAPKSGTMEMICRNGLKCYARIPAKKIRAALAEVERQIAVLVQIQQNYSRKKTQKTQTSIDSVHFVPFCGHMFSGNVLKDVRRQHALPPSGRILVRELELAARMAAESCRIMLWQQTLAAGKVSEARQLAREGVRRLQKLERDFKALWPERNQGSTKHCSPWLRWRMEDYRQNKLRL